MGYERPLIRDAYCMIRLCLFDLIFYPFLNNVWKKIVDINLVKTIVDN